MIQTLHIKNVGIINEIAINLNDGFNVYQIVSIIELFSLVASLFYIISLKRKMN